MLDWIIIGTVTVVALVIVVLVGVVGLSILALSQLDESQPEPRWNRVDCGAVERRARLRKLQGGR